MLLERSGGGLMARLMVPIVCNVPWSLPPCALPIDVSIR